MTSIRSLAGLLLLVILSASASLPAQVGREQAAPPPTPAPRAAFTMGFVDMEKLIEQHPETKARTESLKQRMRQRTDQLKAQMDEMRSMSDNQDLFAPGSPQYFKVRSEIEKLKATLDLEKRIITIEFNLEIVNALKDIYTRCRTVVAEVAKERGLSVIAMYSSSEVSGRSQSELVGDILTRPFVYHEGSLDITKAVLARLK